MRPERLTELVQEVAQERLSLRSGSPTDAQLGTEKLADLAVDYIPELVDEVRRLSVLLVLPKGAARAATSISGGADTDVIPASVQYWKRCADAAIHDSERAFCANEAYNHLRNHVYALAAAPASVTSPVEPGDERDGWPAWLNDLRMYRSSWKHTAEVLKAAKRKDRLMRLNAQDAEQGLDNAIYTVLTAAPALLAENARLRAALTSSLGGAETGGVRLIAAERQRQIEKEGYTSAHDDKHEGKAQMAFAAAAYAIPAIDERNAPVETVRFRTHFWPWSIGYFKPTPNDRVRELVKAGALIAAEIDRLQRAAPHE